MEKELLPYKYRKPSSIQDTGLDYLYLHIFSPSGKELWFLIISLNLKINDDMIEEEYLIEGL
jgi:hypothetical protein